MKFETRSVPGTSDFARGNPPWWRRFGIEWWHDWSSFLWWQCNWSNFTFVQLEAEIEWHMGNATAEAALLGVHVRFSYFWPNEQREELKTTVRLVQAGFIETVPFDPDKPDPES